MAHSEQFHDGGKITRFISDKDSSFAEQFAKLSNDAFEKGANKVEQHIIQPNEPCPKCDSGLRFDLCCGQEANK